MNGRDEVSDLTNRLRGIYSVGQNNEFGTRSFADFIPPISIEAADRIDLLEKVLGDLLNDCINFDDGNLTEWCQKAASNALK